MRRLLLFCSIIVLVSIVNYACNQTKSVSPGYGSGRDTSWTVVTYVYSAANDEYRTGQAVRFSWDTTFPDPKDKTRNIPQRDTVYNIFLIEKYYDSLGHVLPNKKGGDSTSYRWQAAGKRAILKDYNWDYRTAQQEEIKVIQSKQK